MFNDKSRVFLCSDPWEDSSSKNSVIVFGKIRLITDENLTREICIKLCQKFTDDKEYLEKELKYALPRVQCLEPEIEHMTGKLVNES